MRILLWGHQQRFGWLPSFCAAVLVGLDFEDGKGGGGGKTVSVVKSYIISRSDKFEYKASREILP
jgi:hypothetical protein